MDQVANQQSVVTKTLVAFSEKPETQPEQRRILEQLLMGTLPDNGVAEIMTGERQPPATPGDNVTADEVANHLRQVQRYRRSDGILYSRLLMAVTNGPKGFGGPAASSILAHGAVPPQQRGNGREAFLPPEDKDENLDSFRPCHLQQQLRNIAMMPQIRKQDPARITHEIRHMRTGLLATN